MKKFVAAFTALSLIATPALADGPRGGYRGGAEHHESHGGGCGWLCGVIIGGVVVGAIASSSKHRNSYDYDNNTYTPYYTPQPQYVCKNEYARDYYGNYILDQYGRVIFTQHCWYQ